MFNDAVGFNRIFIACGYTDLRRGLMVWQQPSKMTSTWIPMNRETSSSSAAGVPTASRPWFTRATDLSLPINVWPTEGFNGPAMKRK